MNRFEAPAVQKPEYTTEAEDWSPLFPTFLLFLPMNGSHS